MLILAHQRLWISLAPLLLVFPHSRDINEQTGRHVNPSRIDLVQCILRRFDDIVGVDLKHVFAAAVDTGDIEMMLRHIVVVGQEVNGRFGDLDVKVIVPWKYLRVVSSVSWVVMFGTHLLVPPPGQECAVHDPCLGTDSVHRCEVCLDQG